MKNILSFPQFSNQREKTRKARVILIVIWVNIAAAVLVTIVNRLSGTVPIETDINNLILIALMIAARHFVYRGHVDVTGYILLMVLFLSVTGVIVTEGAGTRAIAGYYLVVSTSSLLTNRRFTTFIVVLCSATILWMDMSRTPPVVTDWILHTIFLSWVAFFIQLTVRDLNRALTERDQELFAKEQIQAEQEKLMEELSFKNAELERFVYTISHDLKSPLVTIDGFVGYLEKDIHADDKEQAEKSLRRIHAAVEKMEMLLQDLLELSRIGRLMNPPVAVSLNEIVSEAQANLFEQIQKSKVDIQINSNLPMVYGDKIRLVEVLQNLMENAIKFMGEQPNPTIEIYSRPVENNFCAVFVKDNGIGISEKFHETIFGLFDRLNVEIEGTGIGLTIVKRIIEIHGGTIRVESTEGKGTTFIFTLQTPI